MLQTSDNTSSNSLSQSLFVRQLTMSTHVLYLFSRTTSRGKNALSLHVDLNTQVLDAVNSTKSNVATVNKDSYTTYFLGNSPINIDKIEYHLIGHSNDSEAQI